MKQDDTTARFDEQLLTAYFSGTATAEEEQALLAWIRSSDDNRRTFAELRAVWQRGRMQRPDTQLQARFVRSLNSLNRRIDALGADAPLRRSRRIPLRRFAAAAIVAVALAAAFMTYRVATAPFVHRFHNADTVAMHVAMPDGTDVWLSPGTTLSYDDTFRIDGRNVELDGEAYFDVTHDAGQPFVVTAPAFRVGGRSFAYVGTCLYCPEGTCTRPEAKPCRHPELVRPSLEACGFDIAHTTSELFGIELKWGTDGSLPEYLTLVCGFFHNAENIIWNG